VQGLFIGRASVRPSVSPVDRQQQHQAGGLLLSADASRSVAAGAAYVLSIDILCRRSRCLADSGSVMCSDTLRHLRSANRHLLAVPRFRLNAYGRRAFLVAGPMAWNSLPDFIGDPTSSTDCFRGVYFKRTCLQISSARALVVHPAH